MKQTKPLSEPTTDDLTTILRKVDDLTTIVQTVLQGQARDSTPPSPQLLTRKEAAQMLRVKPYTLCDWKRRGVLVPVQIGGKLLYRLSDIEAAIKLPTATGTRLRTRLGKIK